MPTQEPTPTSNRSPWPQHANYPVGKTRRQRQEQYRRQMNLLIGLVALSLIGAGIFMYLNWRGAGSTKTISCKDFPQYCVPFAGGSGNLAKNESESTRELDKDSKGDEGVVRGFTADNRPFIGDPNAPIHFRIVTAYSCSHCRDYHEGALDQFIRTKVLSGKATLELNFVPGTGGFYTQTANQAALCAGEQGAFWEMNDELFRLVSAYALEDALTLSRIKTSANNMNLDSDKLMSCINSGTYLTLLSDHIDFSNYMGVMGTPTVFVRYGDSGEWTMFEEPPSYAKLESLTKQANGE